MPTKAELEKRLESLEGQLIRCRQDRDILAAKYLKIERILFDPIHEIPVRNDGQPYNYIDSRVHLQNEIKAALI